MTPSPRTPWRGPRPARSLLLVGLAGLGLLGASCGEKGTKLERPGDSGAAGGGSGEDDLELPDLELDPPEAEWSAAEVELAVHEALAVGIPGPATVRDAYLGLMEQGDGVCPGDSRQILDQHLQGCTSSEGYWYAGISEWVEEHDASDVDTANFRLDLWALLGDFEILDPEGHEFHGGGHVAAWAMEIGRRKSWSGEFVGSWLWEADEGWLAEEVSASLKYRAHERLDGGTQLVMDGGITWLGTSLNMDGLTFDGDCPEHPGGVLEVRDPVGSWHRLELEACEPCATVVFAGEEELGEACLDFGVAMEQVTEELARTWEHEE